MITTISSSILLFVVYWFAVGIWRSVSYRRLQTSYGCPPLDKYPSRDPIFGFDYVHATFKAAKNNQALDFQRTNYARHGARAWTAKFLGKRMIYSAAPDNMRAMLTSLFDCFAIAPLRIGNGAITPFTGPAVNSSDGSKWQYSRDLIKPYFDREALRDIKRLEVHVDRLISKIPTDGNVVDMQNLFQRWFLDISTDFLFGQSVNSLDDPSRDSAHRDMMKVMEGLRFRLQLSSMLFLHRDKDWTAACHRIHRMLDAHIDLAYKQLKEEADTGKPATYPNGKPRNDFLWTIARNIPDRIELRNQITGVWIPSNETLSIHLSNAIFALARHPEVVERLRQEILSYGDNALTFEALRGMQYLRWTLNETHRLYPVSPQIARYCSQDTLLPTGGGPHGREPVLCAKGDTLHCNLYIMHRDPAIWGPDAEEFRPDRWAHARPLWGFVPFGGGPRTCPAQQMVQTQASYVLVRLLQKFEKVEARDARPYTGVMRIALSNKHGCQVAFSMPQSDL